MKRIEQITKQELIDALRECENDKDAVATRFNVCKETIFHLAKKFDIRMEKKQREPFLSDKLVMDACEKYDYNLQEMAAHFGCAYGTIWKACRRLGIKLKRGRRKSGLTVLSRDEFADACNSCGNQAKLVAEKFNVSENLVYRVAKEFGWEFATIRRNRISDDEFKAAFQKYNGDCALVGKELGYNPFYVYQRAIKIGVLEQKEHYVWTKKRVVVSDEQILDALEKTGGKKGEAAKLLDITKVTLFLRMRKMKQEGLIPA